MVVFSIFSGCVQALDLNTTTKGARFKKLLKKGKQTFFILFLIYIELTLQNKFLSTTLTGMHKLKLLLLLLLNHYPVNTTNSQQLAVITSNVWIHVELEIQREKRKHKK